ncbi:aspartate/glutamate racemase family protein [Vibrio sp. LaRot3]|uniref:aspartate/glutamate racemase family protein n=1 Tax=Vibrio sp. LaRot3 TaxID=2998829 RepID=UPI0022CE1D29|nr:aspartate/glutamate racemase family protein [Vibrio sp. LaRot3]MDA0147420.1 aspartate/glutamate racemase family protein [Vibrio sp. LaRot3]
MTHKRIMVIVPVSNQSAQSFIPGFEQEISPVLSPDFSVEYVALDEGATPFIQTRTAELWNSQQILTKAIQAEKAGFDGIFVNCFGEPAVESLKEALSIPVVGGFAPAAMNAMMVANRFSIVTVVESVVPMLWDLARQQDIANHVASIRHADLPVDQLHDTDKLKQKLLEQSAIAIEEQGAQAIILGCTGMLEVHDYLCQALSRKYQRYIPVIAPVGSAIGMLQNLVNNQLKPSRLAYGEPTEVMPLYL